MLPIRPVTEWRLHKGCAESGSPNENPCRVHGKSVVEYARQLINVTALRRLKHFTKF